MYRRKQRKEMGRERQSSKYTNCSLDPSEQLKKAREGTIFLIYTLFIYCFLISLFKLINYLFIWLCGVSVVASGSSLHQVRSFVEAHGLLSCGIQA